MQKTETEIGHNPHKSFVLDQISIITIGFPFVIFKFLLGMVCMGVTSLPFNMGLAWLLIGWSIIDALINLANLAMLFLYGRYITEVCLLTILMARLKKNSKNAAAWKEFGTSLDVMLSFTLVAIMVGGDMFNYLKPPYISLWSISVVINVLGAGLSRIIISLPPARS